MALRSFNDAVDGILGFVRAANNRINLVVGSAVRDLVEAVAQEFSKTYVLQEWARRQSSTTLLRQTLTDSAFKDQLLRSLPKGSTSDDVDTLVSDAIDNKAANVGVTRTPATSAVVTLRLQRSTAATGINISIGTITAQTSSNPAIQFRNTEAVVNGSTTFDPVTNLHYIDVAAEAVVSGKTGNVAAGTIRQLSPPDANFSSVTNPNPSENGTDEQTDSSLLDSIEEALLGLNINTFGGYPRFLRAEFSQIQDAKVVAAPDSIFTRLPVGGADIYVIGETDRQITDQYVYLGVDIVLRKQPVVTIVSVTSSGSVQQTFVQGVDFVFVQDTGAFAGSVRGQDRISFLSGHTPVVGTTLIVTYRQNRLIEDAQVFLTDVPDTTVVGADVLVKAAIRVLVDMTMHITPFPEFSLTDVQATVSNNLAQFLAERKLGQGAFYSDLIGVVEQSDGVDRVDVPFTKLARAGQSGNADVPVALNEYVRAGTIAFT